VVCLPHKSFRGQHRTSLPSGLVRTSLRGAGTAPVFRLLRTASETESPGHRFAESATSASFFKTGAPGDPRWAGSIPVRLRHSVAAADPPGPAAISPAHAAAPSRIDAEKVRMSTMEPLWPDTDVAKGVRQVLDLSKIVGVLSPACRASRRDRDDDHRLVHVTCGVPCPRPTEAFLPASSS
jgi:hypothetical protein